MHRADRQTEHRPTSVDAGRLVRRALRGQRRRARNALGGRPPTDRRRHQALDRWFAGFAAQLRRHHELLDTMVIPALAARGRPRPALARHARRRPRLDRPAAQRPRRRPRRAVVRPRRRDWWIGKASDLAAALHHVLERPAGP